MRYLLALALLAATPAGALELGLPAACQPGVDCYVQQFPDMQEGDGTADPFCGTATYDGHAGTDLRVLSMKDVERGVAVTAMADGTVLRGRDGISDSLVVTQEDRSRVSKVECGNGLVLDLGGGYEAQYCHMKQGSIAVKPGATVKRGDGLGEVGASGMAAFPHVHVTIRKDGTTVDPATGHALGEGCRTGDAGAQPLFAPDVLASLGTGEAQIIGIGLAGAPVDHAQLGVSGAPPKPDTMSSAHVGWAWFINLRGGDRVRIRLTGPDGSVVGENFSEPMDRSKASWSGFAGKRGAPRPGDYIVTVEVVRGDRVVVAKEETVRFD